MKKILLGIMASLMAMITFSSCEKEEKIANTMSGVWETTDVLFPRIYKGQTMNPVKTVLQFEHDREGATIGYGVAVEYFDNQELPIAYHHIKWETWTRTPTGEVGIEVKWEETGDKFSTVEPDYMLKENEFYGQCNLSNTEGPKDFRFVRGTAIDVSTVQFWGYSELLPTWHPVSYEGVLDVRREYQGKTYQPKNVIITFDVDPIYNTSSMTTKAFVHEEYDNAPWGSYLADSLRYWQRYDDHIQIYFASTNDSPADYEFFNVQISDTEMKGDFFIDTNQFTPFTMKRIANPDWSAIKEWGITNRLK